MLNGLSSTQKRKVNTEKRNREIADFFNTLYEVERTRYEDCLQRTCAKFYLSEQSVIKIVKQNSPPKKAA
ncbi:MAG: hypothetical protein V4714_14035 [Bacteroidota bacterium]